MRVIARPILVKFMKMHPSSRQPISAWYAEARRAKWGNGNELKRHYPFASILKNGRVVFNIGGNKYRLVAAVHFKSQIVFIRFIGTHAQYDLIEAESI